MHLGFTVLTEESVKRSKKKLQLRERPGEKYEVSRWTPLAQDIAEVSTNTACMNVIAGVDLVCSHRQFG